MEKKQRTEKWMGNRSLFQSVLAGFVLILLAGVGFFFAFRWISPESSISYLLRYTSASLGVLALGGTAVVQYRKQKDSEERVALERDMQFATRLTKAVEHLGSDSRAIRNGGLHELLRLAKDSEKDRVPALEIIVQFISHLQDESEKRSAKSLFGTFLRRQKDRWLCNVDFSDADFSDMDLNSANLIGVNLCSANLRSVALRGANLTYADLNGADLRRADLHDANLTNANLSEVDLRDALLFYANLYHADLCGADLRGASPIKADLCGADLRDTNLTNAYLAHANLSDADLRRANLRGANLTNANLTNANLSDADLTDAKLDGATLDGAILPQPSIREEDIVDSAN